MTDPLTPERIAEIRNLAEKATPRPWEMHIVDDDMFMNARYITAEGGRDDDLSETETPFHGEVVAITLLQTPRMADELRFEENGELIVTAANEIIPALDEIERLRARISDLESATRLSKTIAEQNYRISVGYKAENDTLLLRAETAERELAKTKAREEAEV